MKMDNDELDPRIVAALRDVAPASDDLRDAQIAAALGAGGGSVASDHHVYGNRSPWRRRMSSVAAAVVLLAVGTAYGRSSVHRSPTEPAPGASTTTVPPKTGTGKCVLEGGFWGDVGWTRSVTIAGVPYVFVGRDGAIDILRDDTACTRMTWVEVPTG